MGQGAGVYQDDALGGAAKSRPEHDKGGVGPSSG